MTLALKPATLEVYMRREFAAPRAVVFAAWTDERLIARWWAPRGFTTLSCEMDVRPGGLWRRRLRAPDGALVTKYGVYREIAAPDRIVFTEIYAPYPDVESVITSVLSEEAGRRG